MIYFICGILAVVISVLITFRNAGELAITPIGIFKAFVFLIMGPYSLILIAMEYIIDILEDKGIIDPVVIKTIKCPDFLKF